MSRSIRSTRHSAPALASTATSSPLRASPSVARLTRVSRRDRDREEQWQQIPEEWLEPKKNGKRQAKEIDQESELSELTDEDEHEAKVRCIKQSDSVELDEGEKEDDEAVGEDQLIPVSLTEQQRPG